MWNGREGEEWNKTGPEKIFCSEFVSSVTAVPARCLICSSCKWALCLDPHRGNLHRVMDEFLSQRDKAAHPVNWVESVRTQFVALCSFSLLPYVCVKGRGRQMLSFIINGSHFTGLANISLKCFLISGWHHRTLHTYVGLRVCEFFPSANAIKDSHRAGWIWKCCSYLKQRRSTVMLPKIYLNWYSMSIWKDFTFLSLLSDNESTHEVLQWPVAHAPLTLVRSINLDAAVLNTHYRSLVLYVYLYIYLYIFCYKFKIVWPHSVFCQFSSWCRTRYLILIFFQGTKVSKLEIPVLW